jgi:hypothetical protein
MTDKEKAAEMVKMLTAWIEGKTVECRIAGERWGWTANTFDELYFVLKRIRQCDEIIARVRE